jgi:hypothetical protein
MEVGGRREGRGDEGALTEATFVSGPEPLRFRGYTLPSPLYYVAERATGGVTNPSTLLASKSVADEAPDAPPELPYWPRYESMDPTQRATYLEWLAGGRQSGELPVGYAFTFYYGLERRLLEGGNREAIRRELVRLLGLFGDNRSFRRHATNLLSFDTARHLGSGGRDVASDELPLEAAGCATTRHALAIRLARNTIAERPLPAHLAFTVAEQDPRSTDSVILERTRQEARTLFEKRYRRRYGEGLEVASGPMRRFRYKTGTSALRRELDLAGAGVSLETEYPDPLDVPEQFTGIVELLEGGIDDLRPYNRMVRKVGDGERSLEEWEALPEDLQAELPHPRQEQWRRLVRSHLGDDGIVRVSGRMVAELCDVSSDGRLGRGQCREIVETAGLMGFAVEPDPNVVPQSWASGETVALVQTRRAGEEPSEVFERAALEVYLAVYVATADGEFEKAVRWIVEAVVGELDVDRLECRRLEVLAEVLAGAEQDMHGVAGWVEETFDAGRCERVGARLVRIAAWDGGVTTVERRYLQRAYRSLGLDPAQVRSAVREGAAHGEPAAPVTVRHGSRVDGGPIPEREEAAERSGTVELDGGRLDEVRRETREVAELLNEELSGASEPDGASSESGGDDGDRAAENGASLGEDAASDRAEGQPASEAGEALEERYRPFVRAVTERESWGKAELEELARRHGLMAAACVAAVNEWADEQFGGFLIREGESYEIRTELLEEG